MRVSWTILSLEPTYFSPPTLSWFRLSWFLGVSLSPVSLALTHATHFHRVTSLTPKCGHSCLLLRTHQSFPPPWRRSPSHMEWFLRPTDIAILFSWVFSPGTLLTLLCEPSSCPHIPDFSCLCTFVHAVSYSWIALLVIRPPPCQIYFCIFCRTRFKQQVLSTKMVLETTFWMAGWIHE